MAGISHIIEHLNLPEEVKTDIVAVYRLIAEAESHVHGKTVEEIHFHEVGTADAIADTAGVCLLMHMIAPKKGLNTMKRRRIRFLMFVAYRVFPNLRQ